MFTGIIEAVGEISQLHNNGSDIRLTVQCPHLDMSDVALGDSIATNGVCLTVVEFGDNYYSADVSQETIKYTGFSDYTTGAKVNLEKAMLPTSRFGGHIVSGHVDGVGHITWIIDQQKYIDGNRLVKPMVLMVLIYMAHHSLSHFGNSALLTD